MFQCGLDQHSSTKYMQSVVSAITNAPSIRSGNGLYKLEVDLPAESQSLYGAYISSLAGLQFVMVDTSESDESEESSESEDKALLPIENPFRFSQDFSQLYSQPRLDFEALSRLAQEFKSSAEIYGKIIITEESLPYDLKNLKPVSLGGQAGGVKYLVAGILFKYCHDKEHAPGRWIYGQKGPDHQSAIKAGAGELRGLNAVIASGVFEKGLHFPLAALVDFRGQRLLAISALPIAGSASLVYGSDDSGMSIHNTDHKVAEMMEFLGKQLNLCSHGPDLIFGPQDIEVHRGHTGTYYILDFARLFPPEAPTGTKDCAVFYNFLRPELVREFPKALCSDAFTAWMGNEPDAARMNDNVLQATLFMRDKIKKLATLYSSDFYLQSQASSLVTQAFTNEIHSFGINMRHIGTIRYLVSGAQREFILAEIVARTMKDMIKTEFRALPPQAHPKQVLQYLNCITQPTTFSYFWIITEKGGLKYSILKKFGVGALDDIEKSPDGNLLESLGSQLTSVFSRFCELVGIVVATDAISKSEFHLIDNRFASAQRPKEIALLEEDITLEIRIKYPALIDVATALALTFGKILGNSFIDTECQIRLLTEAYLKCARATRGGDNRMVDFAESAVRAELLKRGKGSVQDPKSMFIHVFSFQTMQKLGSTGSTETQQLNWNFDYQNYYAVQKGILTRIPSKVFESLEKLCSSGCDTNQTFKWLYHDLRLIEDNYRRIEEMLSPHFEWQRILHPSGTPNSEATQFGNGPSFLEMTRLERFSFWGSTSSFFDSVNGSSFILATMIAIGFRLLIEAKYMGFLMVVVAEALVSMDHISVGYMQRSGARVNKIALDYFKAATEFVKFVRCDPGYDKNLYQNQRGRLLTKKRIQKVEGGDLFSPPVDITLLGFCAPPVYRSRIGDMRFSQVLYSQFVVPKNPFREIITHRLFHTPCVEIDVDPAINHPLSEYKIGVAAYYLWSLNQFQSFLRPKMWHRPKFEHIFFATMLKTMNFLEEGEPSSFDQFFGQDNPVFSALWMFSLIHYCSRDFSEALPEEVTQKFRVPKSSTKNGPPKPPSAHGHSQTRVKSVRAQQLIRRIESEPKLTHLPPRLPHHPPHPSTAPVPKANPVVLPQGPMKRGTPPPLNSTSPKVPSRTSSQSDSFGGFSRSGGFSPVPKRPQNSLPDETRKQRTATRDARKPKISEILLQFLETQHFDEVIFLMVEFTCNFDFLQEYFLSVSSTSFHLYLRRMLQIYEKYYQVNKYRAVRMLTNLAQSALVGKPEPEQERLVFEMAHLLRTAICNQPKLYQDHVWHYRTKLEEPWARIPFTPRALIEEAYQHKKTVIPELPGYIFDWTKMTMTPDLTGREHASPDETATMHLKRILKETVWTFKLSSSADTLQFYPQEVAEFLEEAVERKQSEAKIYSFGSYQPQSIFDLRCLVNPGAIWNGRAAEFYFDYNGQSFERTITKMPIEVWKQTHAPFVQDIYWMYKPLKHKADTEWTVFSEDTQREIEEGFQSGVSEMFINSKLLELDAEVMTMTLQSTEKFQIERKGSVKCLECQSWIVANALYCCFCSAKILGTHPSTNEGRRRLRVLKNAFDWLAQSSTWLSGYLNHHFSLDQSDPEFFVKIRTQRVPKELLDKIRTFGQLWKQSICPKNAEGHAIRSPPPVEVNRSFLRLSIVSGVPVGPYAAIYMNDYEDSELRPGAPVLEQLSKLLDFWELGDRDVSFTYEVRKKVLAYPPEQVVILERSYQRDPKGKFTNTCSNKTGSKDNHTLILCGTCTEQTGSKVYVCCGCFDVCHVNHVLETKIPSSEACQCSNVMPLCLCISPDHPLVIDFRTMVAQGKSNSEVKRIVAGREYWKERNYQLIRKLLQDSPLKSKLIWTQTKIEVTDFHHSLTALTDSGVVDAILWTRMPKNDQKCRTVIATTT